MDEFTIVTVVVAFTALAAWANDRFIKLPNAIGVMLAGVLVSGGILWANRMGVIDDTWAIKLVQNLHLESLLLTGTGSQSSGQGILLGLLLFAAAVQIEPASMARRLGLIIWLATIGVVLTAVGLALGFHVLLWFADRPSFILHLLLFGVILAPTDPVAVLSLLRRTSVPGRVREVVTGEALFNDGASIILFLFLLALITGQTETPYQGAWLLGFFVEAGGGIVAGLVFGFLGMVLISTSHAASVMVLVSISIVLGIGVMSPLFYTSCPVACAVAGLVIGRTRVLTANEGRLTSSFWRLIEQVLTAVLFLMIGLELLVADLSWEAVLWSLPVIPLLLIMRFLALVIPWSVARAFGWTTIAIEEIILMTWCGIRGGVSIAMAIAVPVTIKVADGSSDLRADAMVATILVVIASIIIQGLTVPRVAKMVQRRSDRRAAAEAAA